MGTFFKVANNKKHCQIQIHTWGSNFLYSELSSSTSKYISEAVIDMVPLTAIPGDTKIAVVLILTGPVNTNRNTVSHS